jgi:hypothetical protein
MVEPVSTAVEVEIAKGLLGRFKCRLVKWLEIDVDKKSAEEIATLKQQVRELEGFERQKAELTFSPDENVWWDKHRQPHCNYCMSHDRRITQLMKGYRAGVWHCPVHHLEFKTSEYEPHRVVHSHRHRVGPWS